MQQVSSLAFTVTKIEGVRRIVRVRGGINRKEEGGIRRGFKIQRFYCICHILIQDMQ
jgi:hypothetical protein